MDCIFCNIAQKKAEAFIVYEDEDSIAFLDIFPSAKGHTLVIPKKHYENIQAIPDKDFGKMMVAVKKTANAVMKAMASNGVNLVLNNGKAAGQLIMHLHFHIVPRFDNDGLKLSFLNKKAEKEELEKVCGEVKKYF